MRVELLILPHCFKGAETLELLRSEEGAFLTRSEEGGAWVSRYRTPVPPSQPLPLGSQGWGPPVSVSLLLKLGHQPWGQQGNGESGIFFRELYPEHPMVGKSRTEDQTLP